MPAAALPRPSLPLAGALHAGAIALSAALLFWAEPLVGKLLLPLLGGTPAVWNTCVVFFQAALLAGYLWAHVVSRFSPRTQVIAHLSLALAAALALPIAVRDAGVPPGASNPVPWVLAVLARTIGPPFFVLSATSPLLQRWFSRTTAADPYPLYAASNVGSLASLLAFPLVLEPSLTLGRQGVAWASLYAAFVLVLAACGFALLRGNKDIPETAAPKHERSLTFSRRVRWVVLGALPSSLLLGVTNYVATDIASLPLLWVVPLGLYLVTFVLAFSERVLPRLAPVAQLVVPLVALELVMIGTGHDRPAWAAILVHLVTFFVVALASHAELARDRPEAGRLTEFYLWLSFGGVVGSAFNGLVAPLVFRSVLEYPLALVGAAAMLPGRLGSGRARFGLLAAGLAMVAFVRPSAGEVVYSARSFFGVHRVTIEDDGATMNLLHGRVHHGMQLRDADPEKRRVPLLYYHPSGPAGSVLGAHDRPRRIAVVGLGAGSLASYAEREDSLTFFELDPEVERIARNPGLFTFLSDAKVPVKVVLGDARLTLAADPGTYDVLVLDAFSSDAIPVHLLTKEAMSQVYLPHLAPGGRILLHVSNLYFRLDGVIAAAADELGLEAVVCHDDERDDDVGKTPSAWALVARSRADLGVGEDPRWVRLKRDPGVAAWTDDWSNPLQALEWYATRARAAGERPASADQK